MAGTLKPDPAFQKFNTCRENFGNYFRFKPKSSVFALVTMGIIPAALTYFAYGVEGEYNFHRKFRNAPVLSGEHYVPRDKDL